MEKEVRVLFNTKVDKSVAYLNNEAEDEVSFYDEIISLIENANESIDISTMSFSLKSIADKLFEAKKRGVQIRVIGDSGFRYKPGFLQLEKHGIEYIDNNNRALYKKISFQKSEEISDNVDIDTGEIFSDCKDMKFGWKKNCTKNIRIEEKYHSPLLDEYIEFNNGKTGNWAIEIPNGNYHVFLSVGRDEMACNNSILIQGQEVLYKRKSRETTDLSGFMNPMPTNEIYSVYVDTPIEKKDMTSRLIKVNNGKLTIDIGSLEEPYGNTVLNYIEIYRADEEDALGSNDDDIDQIQTRTILHSKFIIIDAESESPILWSSSANLSSRILPESKYETSWEDALIIRNKPLAQIFYNEFNKMWGSKTIKPDRESSLFNRFKESSPQYIEINGNEWIVLFSPSSDVNDIAKILTDEVSTSRESLHFIIEQIKGNHDVNKIFSAVSEKIANDKKYTVFGLYKNKIDSDNYNFIKENGGDLSWPPEKYNSSVHNKIALLDANNSTTGKVICGSMNWTYGGLRLNDEQTLIIKDPQIANQYYQYIVGKKSLLNKP